MKKEAELPFKVGDEVEARSFDIGFRGAWFRCKIEKILKSKELKYMLDYYDFPDDTLETTKVYQLPPAEHKNTKENQCQSKCLGNASKRDEQLMLRPCYPTIYKGNEMPHVSEIAEVAVVVDDTWRVGDLVDWWSSDCYWSGRITKLLDDGKAQVDLIPKPLGEGESYDYALLEDLRPSLDWSLEHGWMVPNQDGTAGRPCARVIKPITEVMHPENAVLETERSAGSSAKPSIPSPLSSNSIDEVKIRGTKKIHKKRSSENAISKEGDTLETIKIPDCGAVLETKRSARSSAKPPVPFPLSSNSVDEAKSMRSKMINNKRSLEDLVSEEGDKLLTIKIPDCGDTGSGKTGVTEADCSCQPKELRTGEKVALSSMHSDSAEASVLDLEEYLNKVKWLKEILLHGISFDEPKTKWEFVEKAAASLRSK